MNGGGYGIDNGDDVSSGRIAARPALHLNLSSSLWTAAGKVTAENDGVSPSPSVTPSTTPSPENNVNTITTPSTNTSQKKVLAPAKVSLKSAKNKKGKKAVVTWKKISGAKGYKIQYATNKKFKKARSKTTAKTSYTIKKLKKKKTYYIRVRAYTLDGKEKVYGKWSNVKKTSIKK